MDSGDVFARVVVRALEIVESCKIIEQAIEKMPTGTYKGEDFPEVPAGAACSRIEGPRGEVFYYVASDGTDMPVRIHVRTPTFAIMPTVRPMVHRPELGGRPAHPSLNRSVLLLH